MKQQDVLARWICNIQHHFSCFYQILLIILKMAVHLGVISKLLKEELAQFTQTSYILSLCIDISGHPKYCCITLE